MRYLRLASVIAVMVALTSSVQAHHSFAMFDKNKSVTLKGEVSRVNWTNPHVYIFIDVPNANGNAEPVRYAIECNSPNVLVRGGWKPSTVKHGDSISITFYPLRDGRPGGLLDWVTLSDGTRIKG